MALGSRAMAAAAVVARRAKAVVTVVQGLAAMALVGLRSESTLAKARKSHLIELPSAQGKSQCLDLHTQLLQPQTLSLQAQLPPPAKRLRTPIKSEAVLAVLALKLALSVLVMLGRLFVIVLKLALSVLVVLALKVGVVSSSSSLALLRVGVAGGK